MNKEEIRKELEGKGAVMEIGSPNDGYARFFTGRSWLASLSEDKDIPVYNVTFENGAHTHWHIHPAGSQTLARRRSGLSFPAHFPFQGWRRGIQ